MKKHELMLSGENIELIVINFKKRNFTTKAQRHSEENQDGGRFAIGDILMISTQVFSHRGFCATKREAFYSKWLPLMRRWELTRRN
jgi:hypothetical protein